MGELTKAVGATQQNVSKHLGVLAQAEIVGREKDGVRVRYFIADDAVFELCDAVCGSLRNRVIELDRLFGQDAA